MRPVTRCARILLAVAACSALACASWFRPDLPAPAGERFEDAWRVYRLSEDAKAMALAIDDAASRRVWGYRYGYLGQDGANKGALEDCTERAQARGLRAQCHLFAVGNRRSPAAVAACADGRAQKSFCDLMNELIPPTPPGAR
jgi:hypothetical protein